MNYRRRKSFASKTYGKETTDTTIDNLSSDKKKIGYKKVNFPVCHQMSVKTVEKRRKRTFLLYLMLRKGRYKTWIFSDEELFHLPSTTGKMTKTISHPLYPELTSSNKASNFRLFKACDDMRLTIFVTSIVTLSRDVKPLLAHKACWYRSLVGITFQDGDRFNSCQVIYSQFGLAIHQNDHPAMRRFVKWAQTEIAGVPDFHKRVLFSDEAHFWLNGYVNKQNCRIWSEANPQVYVETPLHPEKLTGDRYRAMITNFSFLN
ncbi:hypothetical protein TNCV_1125921 [Trichonephila clavipes]|nr:hypothetical protein TNCV_1125921 [Trichonephila clavipes]